MITNSLEKTILHLTLIRKDPQLENSKIYIATVFL